MSGATRRPSPVYVSFPPMTIPFVRLGPTLGLAAILAATAVLLSSCGSSRKPNEPPAGAVTTAQQISRIGARSALSPALASTLPAGSPLPKGSTLTLGHSGWHSEGRFANATGTLHLPGETTRAVSVGFIRIGRRWQITYLEPLQ
jgi:hypothetical protein